MANEAQHQCDVQYNIDLKEIENKDDYDDERQQLQQQQQMR